jgi:GrpB-like predicted nucleotidyltransferase (UPF0157 family)
VSANRPRRLNLGSGTRGEERDRDQATVASLEPAPLVEPLARLGCECPAPDGRDHLPPGGSNEETDWRKIFFLLAAPDRRVHLHVRATGAANQRYALLFRDYLRAHPDAAAAYASLKAKLSELDPPLEPGVYADVKDGGQAQAPASS